MNQQQTITWKKEPQWKLVSWFRADKWNKTPTRNKQISSEYEEKQLFILENKHPKQRQPDENKRREGLGEVGLFEAPTST